MAVNFQAAPEFVEMKIKPEAPLPPAAAISLPPFAEEAIEDQALWIPCGEPTGTLFDIQVVPKSGEVKIFVLPVATAASFVPSADKATENHRTFGALVACVQTAPEFVEVKMSALSSAAATSLVPSAEEATDCQFMTGALFDTHVMPMSGEV